MEDPYALRRKAAHYRELAQHITDAQTQSGLIRLAGQYEAEANSLEMDATDGAIDDLRAEKNL
jgi:hypothetical protein